MDKQKKAKTGLTLFVLLYVGITINSIYAVEKLSPLNIDQVKIDGEIGRRIDITINNNALVLDADKDFLLPFRQRNRKGGYIGLGKFIDSLVRFAAYTKNEKVLKLKKHIIDETIKTQEEDGYIGIFVPQERMWQLWDIHEMGYIVLGLTSDYKYFKEKSSLKAAKKLADYIIRRWSVDPNRQTNDWISVYVATTGLEEAMLALYEQTGEKLYLDFCVNHRKLPDWDTELIQGRWGNLEGHAYYHLCHCLAQLRLHQLQSNAQLMSQSRKTFDFLVRQDGLLIPGLCGYQECWHSNQQGFFKLGETCATAYLVRWLDTMLQIEGESIYGDIMERTIYNGLFAAQSPDGRRLRYYAPFEGPRVYFDGDTYCCPCNFRRIIAELPGMIYYHRNEGLAINMYAESSAVFDVKKGLSLEVRQVTDYPNSGNVVIHLNPSKPARFPVYLRIPRWCDIADITINGDITRMTARGGSFFMVSRKWEAGDEVRLQMPMPLRLVKGRKSQAGRVAVMRGPMLFCLNPERQKDFDPEMMRLMWLDPSSLKLSGKDDSIRPNGLTCEAKFWNPNNYNAAGKADIKLTLTEYADPGCEATYFLVPNPKIDSLTDDELIELGI
ncbi:MAG: glycoside hydrolase family 127 protein [Sedimentisphaerales bacterium]|nr:glycoside hydrolase family 127 protein [Sedimentisphaerales bacterium]